MAPATQRPRALPRADVLTPDAPGGYPDAAVAALARLYRTHPAWRAAAARISARSTSGVWFSHRPGEPWHLVRENDTTRLRPGRAADPDFVFRFTPAAVKALQDASGGVGGFAVRLFELMIDADPDRRVGFRVLAPFGRLANRGYLRLVLESGPKLAAFAAAHGVDGIGSLRRAIEALRRHEPFEWETG